MQLTNLLVPSFMQTLKSMSGWLDKAVAHAGESDDPVDTLMSERLAEDMYPLAAQVRFACFQAQEPAFRLRGLPLPETLLRVRMEGWNADEHPGSLADAQACITEAISFLASLEHNALDARTDLPIALELPNGMVFDMTSEQYARDWSLPQFYFHSTTAYAILRHHGVELGKADYVAHMLAYLRLGSMS